MTLTIELTSEEEARLEAAAQRQGREVTDILRDLIAQLPDDDLPIGARLIKQWEAEGVLGAWADREDIGDSAAYARELRRQAETRARG